MDHPLEAREALGEAVRPAVIELERGDAPGRHLLVARKLLHARVRRGPCGRRRVVPGLALEQAFQTTLGCQARHCGVAHGALESKHARDGGPRHGYGCSCKRRLLGRCGALTFGWPRAHRTIILGPGQPAWLALVRRCDIGLGGAGLGWLTVVV